MNRWYHRMYVVSVNVITVGVSFHFAELVGFQPTVADLLLCTILSCTVGLLWWRQ